MMNIIVRGNKLEFNGKTYKCAVGKAGFSYDKNEGDNCTPIGNFALRRVLYRADKLEHPVTQLPTDKIYKNNGWCDDVNDEKYNHIISLPYSAHHENLWRDDNLYDVVVPIGYNDNPVEKGKGSAIFLHVARPDYSGTEGCVALALPDLLEVLRGVDGNARIIISNE